MTKQILLLIFIFTLAACAQPTPTPTETPLPPTATLTPTPTSTPSPTATLTITPTPAPWEVAVAYGLPEIKAQQLEGMEGVTFEEKPGSVLIKDAQGNILFRVVPESEWINSTATFPENRDIDAFNSPENDVPSADITYMGEYWQWAKRELAPQLKEYFLANEDQLVDLETEDGVVWTTFSDGFMIPVKLLDEDFSAEELPFACKEVFHHTKYKFTQSRTFESSMGGSITANAGDEWLHTVSPVFFYSKKTKEIAVMTVVVERPHESTIKAGNNDVKKMNVVPLSISARDGSGFINPLVEEAFIKSGLSDEEIFELMTLFREGDVSALDGLVLNSQFIDHEIYR